MLVNNFYVSTIFTQRLVFRWYRIVGNVGGGKFWRIDTLANGTLYPNQTSVLASLLIILCMSSSVIHPQNCCALNRLVHMAYRFFSLNSMIRGYHECSLIWNNPIVGEELACERELGNSHDPYAVAVKKTIGGETKVVGNVPRSISAISLLFIRRGGIIQCEVMGNCRYSADLPQGGLEIPCALHFITDDDKEDKKAKKLFQSTLSVEVEEVLLTTPQRLPWCNYVINHH